MTFTVEILPRKPVKGPPIDGDLCAAVSYSPLEICPCNIRSEV